MKTTRLLGKSFFAAILLCSSTHTFPGEALDSPFVGIPLLSAEIKTATGFELSQRFLLLIGRELLPNRTAQPSVYSDAEIKSILTEFDRIANLISRPVDETLANQADRVRRTIVKEVWPGSAAMDPRVADWNQQNREFLVAAQGLSNLAYVLWAIAPEVIAFPVGSQPEYEGLFGSLHASQRYQVHMMLNSERIARLLPSRFNVQKLMQQELEIMRLGEQISFLINYPDGQLTRITIYLRDWVMPEILPYVQNQVLPDLEKLAIRTRCLRTKDKQKCL